MTRQFIENIYFFQYSLILRGFFHLTEKKPIFSGCTHVIVIYCQHEGSRELTTLYNRNLGNIKRQTTLQELQRQNRVLSIDDKFSPYQSNYLKLFINEILTKWHKSWEDSIFFFLQIISILRNKKKKMMHL